MLSVPYSTGLSSIKKELCFDSTAQIKEYTAYRQCNVL